MRLAFLVVIAACNSEADPGEACGEPAGTDGVCAEGTVCGEPFEKSGGLACIPICFKDEDCARGSECKEAAKHAGIKGCRSKN